MEEFKKSFKQSLSECFEENNLVERAIRKIGRKNFDGVRSKDLEIVTLKKDNPTKVKVDYFDLVSFLEDFSNVMATMISERIDTIMEKTKKQEKGENKNE